MKPRSQGVNIAYNLSKNASKKALICYFCIDHFIPMKKIVLIVTFLGLNVFVNDLNAQNSNYPTAKPLTDAPTGYTYDFDLAKQLIIERQVQPANDNLDVKPIIDSKGFPKLSSASALNSAYEEKLKTWMEKNPEIIINSLKNRKNIVHPF